MWRSPKFWYAQSWSDHLISGFFLPLSFIYKWISALRFYKKPYRVGIPVICVGNIIAGGAGKTSTALFLAEKLKAKGKKIFILTRGYGGKIKDACLVDKNQHNGFLVGDEAWMMAAHYSTIIGGDRIKAARLAVDKGADILIMDDGFQNPSLYKDLSFLVVDEYGLGNGRVLPAGPLRELPQSALRRADAIIMIGKKKPDLPLHDLPVIEGNIIPKTEMVLPQALIAFAAIGRPEKFWASLEAIGHKPVECHAFADHHYFSEKEGDCLLKRAAVLRAALITTEKDLARLQAATAPSLVQLAKICYVLPVAFAIKTGEEHKLNKFLLRFLK